MAYATATTDTHFVSPLETFMFTHTFRCLTDNGGRIIEFLEPVHVRYEKGVPFQLMKVLDDTGTPKFISKNGWMFDGGALHDLWLEEKLQLL